MRARTSLNRTKMGAVAALMAPALLFLFSAAQCPAQELQGANAAIAQIKAGKGAPKPQPPKALSPAAKFREQIAAARAGYRAQSPQEAARTWLALVDRFAALKKETEGGGGGSSEMLQFRFVLEAIPPPSAWTALTRAVEARPASSTKKTLHGTALLLLTHLLNNDATAQAKDLASLEALVTKDASGENARSVQTVLQIGQALAERSGDPARIIRSVEQQIELQQTGRYGGGELPDLVTMVGAARAEALLRRTLLTSTTALSGVKGKATLSLAKRLAIELAPKLKAPQWALAQGIDAQSMQVYEAMDRRFPAPVSKSGKKIVDIARQQNDYEDARPTADAYYLTGLIAAGKTAQAEKALDKLRGQQAREYSLSQAFDALEKAGITAPLNDFLYAQLVKNPDLPFWNTYITVAAKAKQTDKMVALLRTALARPGLSAVKRTELRNYLITAVLAADRIEEGITLLRASLAEGGDKPSPGRYDPRTGAQVSDALRLVRLGRLLKRDELVQEGLAAARKSYAQSTDRESYSFIPYVTLLEEIGRTAEAEKVLIDVIARSNAQEEAAFGGRGFGQGAGNPALVQLAGLYSRAGRDADVLTLLREAPNWKARDLVEIIGDSSEKYEKDSLGYIAAKALVGTDNRETAVPILQTMLYRNGGFDPAYELLTQIQGAQALPFLDRLIAMDRFEERPLIWKAVLLFREKRFDEAEKAALAAVAIDPSDGEQGKGRRMRVYGVLADIREAKSDAKQAEFFRGAVTAIRIAENADDYYQAGLLQRGIKMYEEALTHFADAYCIQSRLAVQLAEEGKMAEAEAHYRRAYELMPDSFGRMESHCFGCEHVFQGKRAETLAERVFQDLLSKSPTKPQLHYLLGYLREEQGRFAEAATLYREAVKLDPDYINAWRRYASLGEQIRLPRKDRDAANLALLRLDPQQKHGSANFGEVSDLKELWNALEEAMKLLPPAPPASLLPLPASAVEVEKADAKIKEQNPEYAERMEMMQLMQSSMTRGTWTSPGQALASHSLISLIISLMDS